MNRPSSSRICSFRSGVLAFTLLVFTGTVSCSYAQTVYSGTKLKIMEGSVMTSSNNMKINSGAALDNHGTLVLKKNLVNENASPNELGPGTLELAGTLAQSVSGQNIIQNFVVNNGAGISLNGETQVNGDLNLANGVVAIGDNNLTLGASALVSGTPSFTTMIAADGTGQLRKEFTAPGSFTFPVGDVTGIAEYSPVTLNFTSGSFGTGTYVGVNIVDDVYPNPDITGSYLSRYWNVSQSGITNFTCTGTFQYPVADVIGTEGELSCLKVDPTPWEGYGHTNDATHELTAGGLTGFGTFTGASVRTATLKVFLESLYAGGGIMNQSSNGTGPQFGPGIADQVTVELHNSSNYPEVEYSALLRNISTTGDITLTAIPALFSGSYYITIRHRNSIETTTSSPVSMAGGSAIYDFTNAASKAYGNNMKAVSGGFAIWGGDVNQDGIVDGGDMSSVYNSSQPPALTGYNPEDANGDGIVDGADMSMIYNNSQPPPVQAKKP